ncbi:MAG: hypothetical protein M3Q82_09950 [Actinomycetota bacterium]|nr:hypothetical protein [Actinomycetota bacterium]
MSTTGDLPGLPGNEPDGEDDAVFDELARRAGAALRRPAPADGVHVIAARRRRQQAVKATVAGGAVAAVVIGTLMVASRRDDPDGLPVVDSTPATLPATTTPVPATTGLLPATTTPPPGVETTVAPTVNAPARTTTTSDTEPTMSGGMWPQSSVDEVREAQELADAGDPGYMWQVDPQLTSEEWWGYLREPGAEIVERFLREELGWDHALFNPYVGDDGDDGATDGVIRGVVYLRCAPGETNPMYPNAPAEHKEAPGAERCAPTIDERRYETVRLDLSQLGRRGPNGIWVVSRWAMSAPFTQTDPKVAEADTTALLEEFLGARIAGEGAEGYVDVAGGQGSLALEEVPLLYATTTGAAYERYEIERVGRPRWPYGEMEFTVRLFANGGETVVEQPIAWMEGGGAPLTLVHYAKETTENGQPLAVPYSFLGGEVTLSAPGPWEVSPFFALALALNDQSGDQRVELVGDPSPVATGCKRGPAPADANALARSIQSDPDLQATAPVDVSVGGVEGLALDVTVAPGASVCEVIPSTQVLTHNDGHTGPGPPGLNLDQGSRMRLYLLDLPEGTTTRILAIAIVAPEARFEDVIAAAAPIIESIEFHTG